jgi:hypothetical protein
MKGGKGEGKKRRGVTSEHCLEEGSKRAVPKIPAEKEGGRNVKRTLISS